MSAEPLWVIGVGADGPAGLSAEARAHIARAEVLAAGRRILDFFPDARAEKIIIDADMAGVVGRLKANQPRRCTVVLASGDPLYFGIGRVLLEAFPKEELRFLPHLSSVQLAFARIKETWNDARVISLHGRPLGALLPALRDREAKIALLTDAASHPAVIAELLRQHGLADEYALWVCEDLGGPNERITHWSPRDLVRETFAPLNVVVLLRREAAPTAPADVPLLGIPECALLHRGGQRGLITRREVRLLSLCYLELHPGDVVWDVGAGSGSVAIEAARLAPTLRVWAVEKSAAAFAQMEENVRRFGPVRISLVAGEAPEALQDLPDPDAVFIGGSGGRLADILAAVVARLRPGGRVVLNCITLENFGRGWQLLHEHGLAPRATSVQLAHSRPLGALHCFEPDNLIFILWAKK